MMFTLHRYGTRRRARDGLCLARALSRTPAPRSCERWPGWVHFKPAHKGRVYEMRTPPHM
jgi:hypothetical protein